MIDKIHYLTQNHKQLINLKLELLYIKPVKKNKKLQLTE